MRKIGNGDGWAGMFFLTKFAENAVILILLTLNSITFAGSLESSAQHMKIFYAPVAP